MLLVGHNPGFHDLACLLAPPGPDAFPTAALAELRLEIDEWRGGSARVWPPAAARAAALARVVDAAQPPARASSTVALRRTLAPLTQSSQRVCSDGSWLMPPTEGTNTIPLGVIAASAWAS